MIGAAFLAMGILASSMSRSAVVAAIICLLMLFALRFLAAGNTLGGGLGRLFGYLSFGAPLENFSSGIIDTRDIVYLATFIFFTLFTAVRVIEINRWK